MPDSPNDRSRRLPPRQGGQPKPPPAKPLESGAGKQSAKPKRSGGARSRGSQPSSRTRAAAETPRKPAAKKGSGGRFGKYQIKGILGKGGMGAVYLAEDVELSRLVALKILPKDKAQNITLVRRFKAEGQAAAKLNHPNIVRVHEAGEINGQAYMALEYVEGTDAHGLLVKKGALEPDKALAIVRQVAQALKHAQELGIVHRDIKPSNLMIDAGGLVKLADMGLARSLSDTEEAGITRAGTTVGTVDFMPPEQARDSKATDVRSDIYALGGTWYQLLTTQVPFAGGDLTNKLRAHATKARPNPRDHNPKISEATVAVMHRMMAVDPEKRHQSIDELIADLDSLKNAERKVVNAIFDDLPTVESDLSTELAAEHLDDELGDGDAMAPPKPSRRKSKKSGKDALPPREAKAVSVEGSKFDMDLARNVLIGLCIFAAIGGIGYAISGFGNSFDAGSGGMVNVDGPATDAPQIRGGKSTEDDDANAQQTTRVTDAKPRKDASSVAKPTRQTLADASDLDQFNVEPGNDSRGYFGTIDEALAAVASKGARIVLSDNGPHRLDVASLSNKKQIRIEAGPNTTPIIEMAVGDEEAVLTLDRTSLSLEGVRILTRDFTSKPRKSPVVLFDVQSGAAELTDSAIDTRDVPAIAIRLRESSGRGLRRPEAGHCYASDCSFVGDRLVAIDAGHAGSLVELTNVVASSSGSPAIRFESPKSDMSVLNVTRSTLAGPTAIEVASTARKPSLAMELVDSVLVGTAPGATGVQFSKWASGTGSRLGGLDFAAAQTSWVGVSVLAELPSGEQIETATRLTEALGETITTDQIVPDQAIDDASPWTVDIERAGAKLASVPFIADDSKRRAAAWDGWGRPSVEMPKQTTEVDFDPKKYGSLGEFIASGRCPDGCVINLEGDVHAFDSVLTRISDKQITLRPLGKTATLSLDGELQLDDASVRFEDLTIEADGFGINADNSDLSFANCRIVDESPARNSPVLVTGDRESQLAVLDSIVDVKRLASGGLASILRNSAVVDGDAIFDVEDGGRLHLFDSTFVLEGPLVSLPPEAADPPRVWIERSVVGTEQPNVPVVLAPVGMMVDEVVWFDDQLALQDKLDAAVLTSSPLPLSEQSWRSLFPRGQSVNVMTASGDVKLTEEPAFMLAEEANATTGRRDGGPLGADPMQIGPPVDETAVVDESPRRRRSRSPRSTGGSGGSRPPGMTVTGNGGSMRSPTGTNPGGGPAAGGNPRSTNGQSASGNGGRTPGRPPRNPVPPGGDGTSGKVF